MLTCVIVGSRNGKRVPLGIDWNVCIINSWVKCCFCKHFHIKNSASLFFCLFHTLSSQWSIQAHPCMHIEESAWSFLIIQCYSHGRQMAHLIFQTDVPFWDLMIALCVCVFMCGIRSKTEQNKHIHRSPLLWRVCLCACVVVCDLWAFWCPLFYSFGCSVSIFLSWYVSQLISGWLGRLWQVCIPELYLSCFLLVIFLDDEFGDLNISFIYSWVLNTEEEPQLDGRSHLLSSLNGFTFLLSLPQHDSYFLIHPFFMFTPTMKHKTNSNLNMVCNIFNVLVTC